MPPSPRQAAPVAVHEVLDPQVSGGRKQKRPEAGRDEEKRNATYKTRGFAPQVNDWMGRSVAPFPLHPSRRSTTMQKPHFSV